MERVGGYWNGARGKSAIVKGEAAVFEDVSLVSGGGWGKVGTYLPFAKIAKKCEGYSVECDHN